MLFLDEIDALQDMTLISVLRQLRAGFQEGRADADLTPWLEYFLEIVSRVFTLAKAEALKLAAKSDSPEPAVFRRLEPRARIVLGLFARSDRISATDVAAALGLSDRMARRLLQAWVTDGWLVVADPSRRGRTYELSATYRPHNGTGSLTCVPPTRHHRPTPVELRHCPAGRQRIEANFPRPSAAPPPTFRRHPPGVL